MGAARRSITALARDAAIGLSSLAANEARLAAAELQENINGSASRLRTMIIGAALLIPGVVIGLAALAFAIYERGVSASAALGSVGAVAILGGLVFLKISEGAARATNSWPGFFPGKTLNNLRKDIKTIKEAAR